VSTNSLTYSIQQELLAGTIGGRSFHVRAASGGRRGRAGDLPSLQGLDTWNPSVKLPEVRGSVRAGGVNMPDDTRTVQALLRRAGIRVMVDGRAGPKTIAAIAAFQLWALGRGTTPLRIAA
jgi:hypothetical protein